MHFKRTFGFFILCGQVICLLLLAGKTYPQEPGAAVSHEGVVVISDKVLFSFGSVMMILALAGGAWAVKSDITALRKELSIHAANPAAHHSTELLEAQFMPRRECESEFRHIAESLLRIEGLIREGPAGPMGPAGPAGERGLTGERGAAASH